MMKSVIDTVPSYDNHRTIQIRRSSPSTLQWRTAHQSIHIQHFRKCKRLADIRSRCNQ